MSGQMCWLARFDGNGELILHLRLDPQHPWKPYTQFPHLTVPDYNIPGASKGFATSQRLLSAGWVLLPVAKVNADSDSSQAA